MKKAIRIEIYKSSGGDCSNGGISSKFNEILLECENGWIDIDGTEENLCRVVTRKLFCGTYKHIEPVKPEGLSWMYGGCLVYSSDTRFKDLTGELYPLTLHDRHE